MRPRWPEFLSAESLVSEDTSDGATGWGILGYGILITSIVSVLLFSKEYHVLHILIMLMATAVFAALGFLYETIWGSHCPAWTFCTGAFPRHGWRLLTTRRRISGSALHVQGRTGYPFGYGNCPITRKVLGVFD